ncbi:MAG: type II secretion system protein [Lentisphaerae bacterium]|nr:type II secretion system protein [Lentisphaerota bacterium]
MNLKYTKREWQAASDPRKSSFAQDTCQVLHCGGFTLMEMIVVIAIISILFTMMTAVVTDGRRQARQTDCKSNLRQMGIAILVYRGEHNGDNPPWLSNLYPDYLDDLRCFVCKADRKRGVGPVRPDDPDKYSEVIDNDSKGRQRHSLQNDDVRANSYFYEFSVAECPWKIPQKYDLDGSPESTKWWEYKEDQMRYGNTANGGTRDDPVPYSQSKLPIVRCYHHHNEGRIRAYHNEKNKNDKKLSSEHIAINIAYAGNVYVGPLWWEGMPEPGEIREKGGN